MIGIDLDLTLVDSREGILAVYERLSLKTGVAMDRQEIEARLGCTLESELSHWFPPQEIDRAKELYREMYPTVALPLTRPFRDAPSFLAAARERSPVWVVTGKSLANARRQLAAAGLRVDGVIAERFGPGKAEALRELGAHCYIGDHPEDMRAAHESGAVAWGVTTGNYMARSLWAAGADAVFDNLESAQETLEDLAI